MRDPDSYLGRIFDTPVPGNDGMTARTTFDAWLKAGSPLPDPANGDLEPLSLGTGTEEREAHPTGIVFGFGTVH